MKLLRCMAMKSWIFLAAPGIENSAAVALNGPRHGPRTQMKESPGVLKQDYSGTQARTLIFETVIPGRHPLIALLGGALEA